MAPERIRLRTKENVNGKTTRCCIIALFRLPLSRVPGVRYPPETHAGMEALPSHRGAWLAMELVLYQRRKPGPVGLALKHFHGERNGSRMLPRLQASQETEFVPARGLDPKPDSTVWWLSFPTTSQTREGTDIPTCGRVPRSPDTSNYFSVTTPAPGC